MIKTIRNKEGMTARLGRTRPKPRAMRMHLKNYLMRTTPAPPATCDYQAKAIRALSMMYGNDTLGDCVIAMMAHGTGVFTGNSGFEYIFTTPQIVGLYSVIGGYDPTKTQSNGFNPTDNGCDEQTAFDYWVSTGCPFGQNKAVASMTVNPLDPVEVRLAIYLFENAIYGVELPDAWISPFPSASNFTWNTAGAADENNGHCFLATGYGKRGPVISTWGMLGTITDAATAEYCTSATGGALNVILTKEIIVRSKTKAPNGLDWSQLEADFDSMGGSV